VYIPDDSESDHDGDRGRSSSSSSKSSSSGGGLGGGFGGLSDREIAMDLHRLSASPPPTPKPLAAAGAAVVATAAPAPAPVAPTALAQAAVHTAGGVDDVDDTVPGYVRRPSSRPQSGLPPPGPQPAPGGRAAAGVPDLLSAGYYHDDDDEYDGDVGGDAFDSDGASGGPRYEQYQQHSHHQQQQQQQQQQYQQQSLQQKPLPQKPGDRSGVTGVAVAGANSAAYRDLLQSSAKGNERLASFLAGARNRVRLAQHSSDDHISCISVLPATSSFPLTFSLFHVFPSVRSQEYDTLIAARATEQRAHQRRKAVEDQRRRFQSQWKTADAIVKGVKPTRK
jgi:hypothetical protein